MSAVLIATAVSATASFADLASVKQMEDSLRNDLNTIGVAEIDFTKLSHNQLIELNCVVDSQDTNVEKAANAEAILNSDMRDAHLMTSVHDFPAASEMEKIMVSELAGIGITLENPENLTMLQVAQITDAINAGGTNEEQAAAVGVFLKM